MTDNRKNVVLDLDNTLLSAEALTDFPFHEPGIKEKAVNFAIHDMDGYYIVFERPGVQEFLDRLFNKYNVSIWTAASKDYALFVIKYIILTKPERRLKYIMFSYHCELSRKLYKNSKDLRLLWDKFKLEYSPNDTLIIDDLDEVYTCQPNNAINIKYFEILGDNSENDKVLYNIDNNIEEVFNNMNV